MAEILAHPWLEGPTPGITYVPSPSVSELAQPLPSALHIDRDLFESLCVIWGRHADVDCIQADLLSPAGQGTLAKAFYFLLQKHREMAMKEHGIFMDIDEVLNTNGKIVTKQYAAPRSKLGRHSLDLSRIITAAPPQYLRSGRPAPPPPSRSASPPRLSLHTTLPMERAASRPHPPSPVGPRPQKPRPQGQRTSAHLTTPPSFVPNPDVSRARSQTLDDSAQLFRDRSSAQAQPRRIAMPPMQRGAVSAPAQPFPPRTEQEGSRHASARAQSASGFIYAPVPLTPGTRSTRSTLLAPPNMLDEGLTGTVPDRHVPTTPLCPEVEMASPTPTHPYASASPQAVPWMSQCEPIQRASGRKPEFASFSDEGRRRSLNWNVQDYHAEVRHPRSDNKENKSVRSGYGGQQEEISHSGGLGFGHSVPMAKEMGNVLFLQEAGNGQQLVGKKDRKSRRTSYQRSFTSCRSPSP